MIDYVFFFFFWSYKQSTTHSLKQHYKRNFHGINDWVIVWKDRHTCREVLYEWSGVEIAMTESRKTDVTSAIIEEKKKEKA